MTIAKATCPECGAKLSSPDGFGIGEAVECPKREMEFKARRGPGEAEGRRGCGGR